MNLATLIGPNAAQGLLDALDRRSARRFDAGLMPATAGLMPATAGLMPATAGLMPATAAPTGFDLWPANPATAQAIEEKHREEWADGAQQRRIDARNERDDE